MSQKKAARPDLPLLLSLLFVIIMYPLLEHTGAGRTIVAFSIFLPLSFATVEMSELKHWGRRSLLLIGCILALSVADAVAPSPVFASAKWTLVAVFLVLS